MKALDGEVIQGVPIDENRYGFMSTHRRPRSAQLDRGRRDRVRSVTWLTVGGAIFACGAGFGGLINAPPPESNANHPSPQPSITQVIQTHTVYALTQPCEQVLLELQQVLDAAVTITDARGAQLDILEQSYSAILRRDWKKLNDLTDEQRELGKQLADEGVRLLPKSADIQRDIKTCRDTAPTE